MPDHLRLDGMQLLTPVHRYTHSGTGQKVTLVATMHVGEPDYYAQLLKVIDELEADGAVVQCEASRLLPDEDATAPEQELLAVLESVQEGEEAKIHLLGWVNQVEALPYPSRWQFNDMSSVEVIRLLGPEMLGQKLQNAATLYGWADDDELARKWFRLNTAMMLRAQAGEGPMPAQVGDDVLLGKRNEVALAGVDATPHDVVLIWGARHVPGLHTGLVDRGFTRVASEWYRVADLLPDGV